MAIQGAGVAASLVTAVVLAASDDASEHGGSIASGLIEWLPYGFGVAVFLLPAAVLGVFARRRLSAALIAASLPAIVVISLVLAFRMEDPSAVGFAIMTMSFLSLIAAGAITGVDRYVDARHPA